MRTKLLNSINMDSEFILKLSDNQRKDFIDYCRAKIESANQQIVEFTDLLKQLGDTHLSLNDNLTQNYSSSSNKVVHERGVLGKSAITSEFKNSWSWGQKINFILSNIGHCLSTREIVDELEMLDSKLDNSPIRSISTTLSVKVNKGILFNRYKVVDSDNPGLNQGTYYYGLKEWFDDNDKLIDEKYRGKQ